MDCSTSYFLMFLGSIISSNRIEKKQGYILLRVKTLPLYFSLII